MEYATKMVEVTIHSFLDENKALVSHNSDFSDRDKAVKILQEFFGEENVIPVSIFSALKPVSLIKDLSKFYDVPFEEVNAFTVNMISEVFAVKKATPGFDAAQYELNYDDLAAHSKSYQTFMKTIGNKFPGFEETLRVLAKQQRGSGKHAGGVIVTENSRDSMPLIKAKGGLQTPWSEGLAARHLEAFGFLKFDILGLGTLKMFENCIRRIIKKETGKKYVEFKEIQKWFYDHLHPDNNPMTDPKVYQHVYWDGNYSGVFQFVKPNVQRFMKQMKPKSIVDIATATSLFRPGPMGIKAHELYLENRTNPSNIKYKHPLLKEVLGDTYGLVVFQEQLQLIYHKLAGVPLDETDAVRKAFTKKDQSTKDKQEEERRKLRNEFVTKCYEANKIPDNVSGSIFDEMEKFVSYSFNKCLHEDTFISVYDAFGKFVAFKSIKNVKSDDYVRSRDESAKMDVFVKVKQNHENSSKELFEFQLDNGIQIKCSKDHKFRVIDGRMLPISEIQENDLEIVCNNKFENLGIKTIIPLSSKLISSKLPKFAVYALVNHFNDRIYIGGSNRIVERWHRHRKDLKNGVHHSASLQEDYNKFGIDFFSFGIIEITKLEETHAKEQMLLDKFYDGQKECYNFWKVVDRATGISLPEKTRIAALVANQTEHMKEVHKRRIAASNKASIKTFSIIDPNGNLIEVTIGIAKFAKENNLSQSAISDVLNKKRKHHKGWTCPK